MLGLAKEISFRGIEPAVDREPHQCITGGDPWIIFLRLQPNLNRAIESVHRAHQAELPRAA
jgi:hypothetical protein